MRVVLHVWRQESASVAGRMVRYELDGVSPDESFLEMLDKLNENLIAKSEEPIAFDHDCREGICGTCSLMIDGVAHGPETGTTTCQLHMRSFRDGAEIYIEPFRAKAFPVLRDLVTDRTAFDRIIEAGGFISVNTGSAPDANAVTIAREKSSSAMDAAQCIGCGACVASCKNASAMLFVGAKISHLAHLPQGQSERWTRAKKMVAQMDLEGLGSCTNQYECEAVCPKEISVSVIADMNRDYIRSTLT